MAGKNPRFTWDRTVCSVSGTMVAQSCFSVRNSVSISVLLRGAASGMVKGVVVFAGGGPPVAGSCSIKISFMCL